MPAQHFRLGPLYLGSRPAPGIAVLEHSPIRHIPLSLVYICPHCGDAWFRAEVEGSRWFPIAASCSAHGSLPEATAPGSILLSWRQELHGHLPLPVLKYEFTTLLSHYEKAARNDHS